MKFKKELIALPVLVVTLTLIYLMENTAPEAISSVLFWLGCAVVVVWAVWGWKDYGIATTGITANQFIALSVSTLGPLGFPRNGKGAGSIGALFATLVLVVVPWSWHYVWTSFVIGLVTSYVAVPIFQSRMSAGGDTVADGSKTKYDIPKIIWDEVHGMVLAAFAIDLLGLPEYHLWSAFTLFRLFDILKPFIKKFEIWCVSESESLFWQSFWVHFDDTLAGKFAAITIWVATIFHVI